MSRVSESFYGAPQQLFIILQSAIFRPKMVLRVWHFSESQKVHLEKVLSLC